MAIRGLGHSIVNLNKTPKHEQDRLQEPERGGFGNMYHSHSKVLEDSVG